MASPINVHEWIEENKKFFLPPVCNKMMHNEGQMKLFFVGGPNQRKDFHIDCGEELFYQIKGDMVLKVVEKGKHRDIKIREGEMFLLPGCIEHSPQRVENAVGLVIERERHTSEKDGLRYFQEKDGAMTTDALYEAWFHCTNLGTQLPPVINRFFASEEYKTGKPLPGSIPENPPVILDKERDLGNPFLFSDWLAANRAEIDAKGKKQIFDASSQFQVFMYGKGTNTGKSPVAETWVWQWEGSGIVTMDGKEYKLKKDDTLLIPQNTEYTVNEGDGGLALVCYQDPTKSKTWPTA